VAGLAIISDFGQRAQRADNRMQKHRSAPLNCARRRDRRMTITWCESARYSNPSSKRDRSPDWKFARSPLTDKIIVGQETVAELPGIQPIPCGWNF